ncbi:MAG: hypothetical protein H8E98_01125, partial [Bacteroidetes bacterium]|nr:hypothetical protein [Bacteroidota bacterium]
IIIDEFEQLLSQCLDGQLIKNNSEKFSADLLTFLKILINNATKTILLDADIGQLSVEFCKHLFPNNSLKNIYLYWNTYKMEKRDIYFTYHQYHLYSILKEHLDSGKKVLYTSNRREEILVIHGNIKHHYPHLRALPITKDNVNTQNVINLISDPKKFLSHWDVILYNSAISTGCSFLDTNKQFDAIFGYFVNRISPYKEKYYTQYTTSPLQNSQMLARLRSDVPIYLHINVQKVSDIEDKLSNYYKVWELNKPEVKMHLGIYEKYLEINDRFNSIYYGSLRAYYHQKGWNTELLYATLKELNDGGKTFHPVNLKIIHLRKLIDYGDIERKDIDNTTFDTFKLIKTILDKLDFDLNTLSFRRGYIINHGQKIRDFRKYCLGKKLDLDNLLDIKVPTLYDNNQKETFDNSKLFIFLYTFFKNILNLDLNVYEPWLDEQDVSKKSPAMKQKDVEVYGLEKTPYNTDDLLNFDIDAWDS